MGVPNNIHLFYYMRVNWRIVTFHASRHNVIYCIGEVVIFKASRSDVVSFKSVHYFYWGFIFLMLSD